MSPDLLFTTATPRCRPSKVGLLWTGVFACMLPTCFGFSVDDAWIVSRVAAHGAEGLGFGFNALEPTDAVTPLGYAHFLALVGRALGRTTAEELFLVARTLGVLCALAAYYFAGSLAERLGLSLCADVPREDGGGGRGRPLLSAVRKVDLSAVLVALFPALSLPLVLWAGAGLTPPVVALLLVLTGIAADAKRRITAGVLLALAVGLRLELTVVAFAGLAVLAAQGREERSRALHMGALVFAWLVILSLVRFGLFGRLLPLSFLAKAPDFSSGLRYALVTLIWGGLPWLLLSRRKFFSLRPGPALGLVFFAHLIALVYAGGDWMPGLRLTAPLYPLLASLLASLLAPHLRRTRFLVLPLLAAALGAGVLLSSQGADYRAVVERRLALVEQLSPILRQALPKKGAIATVDIGWVGLSTERRILDLGGVTSPEIAEFPGGHTSRQIPNAVFESNNVQVWILRAQDRAHVAGSPLQNLHPVYTVDMHLMRQMRPEEWRSVGTLPLPGTEGQYVILKRATGAE